MIDQPLCVNCRNPMKWDIDKEKWVCERKENEPAIHEAIYGTRHR